jgi:hypothetical protein
MVADREAAVKKSEDESLLEEQLNVREEWDSIADKTDSLYLEVKRMVIGTEAKVDDPVDNALLVEVLSVVRKNSDNYGKEEGSLILKV